MESGYLHGRKVFLLLFSVFLLFGGVFSLSSESRDFFEETSLILEFFGPDYIPTSSLFGFTMDGTVVGTNPLLSHLRFENWISTYSLYFDPSFFLEIGSIVYWESGRREHFRWYSGIGTAVEWTDLTIFSMPLILSAGPEWRFGRYFTIDMRLNFLHWEFDGQFNGGREAKLRLAYQLPNIPLFGSLTAGYLCYVDGSDTGEEALIVMTPQYTIGIGYSL